MKDVVLNNVMNLTIPDGFEEITQAEVIGICRHLQ